MATVCHKRMEQVRVEQALMEQLPVGQARVGQARLGQALIGQPPVGQARVQDQVYPCREATASLPCRHLATVSPSLSVRLVRRKCGQ